MAKKTNAYPIIASLLLLGSISSYEKKTENVNSEMKEPEAIEVTETIKEELFEETNKITIATCDGITIIEDCEVDGKEYILYKFHNAVEEVSHIETKTTTTQEIIGYCTLCKDGTFSPSCAVGRGACSHHGGVKAYDSPRYKEVTNTEEVKIIDSPAIDEYWEIIEK